MASSGQVLRDVYVARQAIFDPLLNVCAYEVLFRNTAENRADIDDPSRATAELLLNVFVELGLDAIVGTHKAFVNVTREFVTGLFPVPPEEDRLVLEILPDVAIDEELVAGVVELVKQGYEVALDVVAYDERLDPMLKVVQVVKVDPAKLPREELSGLVAKLRRFPVRLMAEKIETPEEFDYCKTLGFTLFQGHFLCRPHMIGGSRQRANQTSVLRLLSRLRDPQISIEELEHLVGSDPGLTYRLLRYINSSKFSLRRKIESLRQVVVLLGTQQVRTLAMLIFLAGNFQQPNEALNNAMIRALLCERLAKLRHQRDQHTYFTAGLLSSLDAVLDLPLEEVVNSLPLTDELRSAVLEHAGPVGQAIRSAIAHERGDWANMGVAGLEPAAVRGAYLAALSEARSLWSDLLS